MDAVEGIMGHFEPCIPVHINEFHERNTWFDYHRYCKPFITEQVLNDIVGNQANYFKQNYLQPDGYGVTGFIKATAKLSTVTVTPIA